MSKKFEAELKMCCWAGSLIKQFPEQKNGILNKLVIILLRDHGYSYVAVVEILYLWMGTIDRVLEVFMCTQRPTEMKKVFTALGSVSDSEIVRSLICLGKELNNIAAMLIAAKWNYKRMISAFVGAGIPLEIVIEVFLKVLPLTQMILSPISWKSFLRGIRKYLWEQNNGRRNFVEAAIQCLSYAGASKEQLGVMINASDWSKKDKKKAMGIIEKMGFIISEEIEKQIKAAAVITAK